MTTDIRALRRNQTAPPSTLFLGGLLALCVVIPGWYFAEATGLAATPWAAVAAGIAVGFITRAATSRASGGSRAMVATTSFVVAAAAVAAILAFVDVGQVYGAATSMANYEFHIQSRFRDLNRIIAHVIGFGAALAIAQKS